jgi:hypothetical protein
LRNLPAESPSRRALALCIAAAVCVWLAAGAGSAFAAKICVLGTSKSLCKGKLTGAWPPASCTLGGATCTTGTASQLSFLAALAPGDPSCDETPELSNLNFNASFPQANLRLQSPDPVRGSLIGQFSILNNAGLLFAKGTFEATLGVGTHRAACGGSCSLASCEQCYAATFNPSSKSWQIHSEGFLRGQVTAGPHKGCGIRWSLAGTFTALGTAQGPDPNHPWDFCGNLDGVLECPCI